jgi:hypothetical protein
MTEKRTDGRLCHIIAAEENFQSFTMICRKPHVASSICLHAIIFQNPEGTLWTHYMIYVLHKFSKSAPSGQMASMPQTNPGPPENQAEVLPNKT